MPQTTGVAILATQLAITDRRALSQAWYSALHLAERGPAAPAQHARGVAAPRSAAVRPAPAGRAPSGHHSVATCAARPPAATPARGAAVAFAPERRTPKTELVRRIERGLTRRMRRGVPSSFAVSAAGGRVHLLVRSDGARTRVVAVCAATVRERVERALAHARFALAAGGIRTEHGPR